MTLTTERRSASAGVIVRGTGRPVPLERVHVDALVEDMAARVTVEQRYRNTEDVPLEVVYVFPLDEGAAVCGFTATVDGVRYAGAVMERDEAFERYDDALEAGHGAYLLGQDRPDVFTASLGNVKPGAEIALSITYVTRLATEGPAARFTLPTAVSPRYAPASDRAGVGETAADKLNPPVALEVPYAFTFEMKVAMAGRVRGVTSPTHPIESEVDGSTARVRLAQRSAPMDRDLVVVIAADGLDVPHAIVERGGRGTAALVSFVPAFDRAARPAEVVFVIDRSGSMQGSSIEEVRNALQLCLRSLTAGCAFNIVSFGSSYSTLFPESRLYDEASLRDASDFVRAIDADMGGTELLQPVAYAIRQKPVAGLSRQVLLMTDGEITNTEQVVGFVGEHRAEARFFTFGIGAGASHHLVRGVARASGGAAEFIDPGERIEGKVMRQFARLLAPAVTDVAVDWGGSGAKPAATELPPVFAGEPVAIFALAERLKAATVKLSCAVGGRAASFEVPLDPAGAVTGETIATLAARARIRELEDRGTLPGRRGSRQQRRRATEKVAAEIAALGVKYQLCSRETSFVAVEERETPTDRPVELRRIPVALTSGWGGIGRGPLADQALSHRFFALAASPDVAGSSLRASARDLPSESACDGEDLMVFAERPQFCRVMHDTGRAADREHDRLVALQSWEGYWDLTREFAAAIHEDFDRLRDQVHRLAGDDEVAVRAAATALALAWLETNAGQWHREWAMVADKARGWLDACGAAPGECESWEEAGHRLLLHRQPPSA